MNDVEGAHDIPPMTWRDRAAAQRELWRRDGIRGELHDARIIGWNLLNLMTTRVITSIAHAHHSSRTAGSQARSGTTTS